MSSVGAAPTETLNVSSLVVILVSWGKERPCSHPLRSASKTHSQRWQRVSFKVVCGKLYSNH